MEPRSRKLEQRQQERMVSEETTLQQSGVREFGSVEELLRHDATQNPPPAELAKRVEESIRQEPARASFWSRWFGRRRG